MDGHCRSQGAGRRAAHAVAHKEKTLLFGDEKGILISFAHPAGIAQSAGMQSEGICWG
jgi:hypothetical protein